MTKRRALGWIFAVQMPLLTCAAMLATGCVGAVGPEGPEGATGPTGSDGSSAFVNTVAEPPGPNCANGGEAVQIGTGTQITKTVYVCNGQNGANGQDGVSAVVNVTTEPAGANCADGGYRIVIGTTQAQSTEFVCNGQPGPTGTVTIQPIASGGATCPSGGLSITAGSGAGAQTYDVCNGSNSLIQQIALPVGSTQCPGGGVEILSGVDTDGDGILQSTEVNATSFVCAPVQQCLNSQRFSMDPTIACPEQAAYAAWNTSLSTASIAVTSAGDAYTETLGGSSASAQAAIVHISPDGVINSNWVLLPPTGVMSAALAVAQGSLYVVTQTDAIAANETAYLFSINPATAAATQLESFTWPNATKMFLAALSSTEIFASNGDTLYQPTPPSGLKTVQSFAQVGGMASDPTTSRIYWVDGKFTTFDNIYYFSGTSPGSSQPLSNAFSTGSYVTGSLNGIAVDEQGRLYVAGCLSKVSPQTACDDASLWRVDPKTGTVTPLLDNSIRAEAVAYNPATHQLFVTTLSSGTYSLERIKILK